MRLLPALGPQCVSGDLSRELLTALHLYALKEAQVVAGGVVRVVCIGTRLFSICNVGRGERLRRRLLPTVDPQCMSGDLSREQLTALYLFALGEALVDGTRINTLPTPTFCAAAHLAQEAREALACYPITLTSSNLLC